MNSSPDASLRDALVALTHDLVLPPQPPSFNPLADFMSEEEREAEAREEEASRHVTEVMALIGIENRMVALLQPIGVRFEVHQTPPEEWARGRPVISITGIFPFRDVPAEIAASVMDAFRTAHNDIVAAFEELQRGGTQNG